MKIYSYTHKPKVNNVDSMQEYLKNFIGKELWVKVGIDQDYNLFYIRVISISGSTLTCNQISAVLIDESEDYLLLQEDIDRLEYIKRYDIYDIEVPEDGKLDVYSTDEIMEILKK